eukprot:PhM_4_TR18800/c1_g1_i3/m.91534
MLQRLSLHVLQSHNGTCFPELIVNCDKTAAAFCKLAESGLALDGTSLSNAARSERRSSTLMCATSLSGRFLEPFVIWNGQEGSARATVKSYDRCVQYQTVNHYISTGALLSYINNVLRPYYDSVLVEFGFTSSTPMILLLDCVLYTLLRTQRRSSFLNVMPQARTVGFAFCSSPPTALVGCEVLWATKCPRVVLRLRKEDWELMCEGTASRRHFRSLQP